MILVMTVRIRGTPVRRFARILGVVQRVTLISGLCLLIWPLFVSVESLRAQWAADRELALAMVTPRETITPARRAVVRSPGAPRRGAALARFEVPRLKLSYALLEGTDHQTLDKSIGHIEDTALPGRMGNIGIAGHRNTHFRKLEWIRRGDEIVLTSPQGRFRYNVEWARLFRPGDIEVLDPSHGPAVTLITCFPFEYVGAAPLRYVIRALPDQETRARLTAGPQTATAATP
jgi:sortase A